jgi:uncharacterized protein (TIGR02594 family)
MKATMSTEPLHLSVARMMLGLKEIPGPTSNQVILQWAKDLKAPQWYMDDDQPWCALFMNRLLMACQLPVSGPGFDLLRAKSFEKYGELMGTPSPGAILVFTRAGGGHVGLYLGERLDAYRVLGANQSNSVSEAWIAKDRLTSIRWPQGVPRTNTGRVWLTNDGKVSTNEA